MILYISGRHLMKEPIKLLILGLWLAAAAPPRELAAATEPSLPRVDFSGPIRKLSQSSEELESFSIEVTWRRDKAGSVTPVKVFGSGVGIWKSQAQFRLTRKEVLAVVGMLDGSGFGEMPDQFGEDLEKDQALQMKGQVVVRVGAETKRVTQLMEGPQSASLDRLAREIFDSCERAVVRGSVTASNLPDALRKVLAGELAPETVQIYVQRLVERPAADVAVLGWMLHSEGRDLVLRERAREGGYGVPVRYRLGSGQFQSLARALLEADPASFPSNLFAPDYTDFSVKVLNQARSIQARRFLHVTPQTHGEVQKKFDALYAALDAMHARALKEGVPAPGAE
jgi:hypothetical protein